MAGKKPGHEPVAARRRVLKKALIGATAGAVLLPERWLKPVIEAVIVPAHAETSPATTTTGAPTTTAHPTTTAAPPTTIAPG
jgi:hypothetical protein